MALGQSCQMHSSSVSKAGCRLVNQQDSSSPLASIFALAGSLPVQTINLYKVAALSTIAPTLETLIKRPNTPLSPPPRQI
jgi:hypothetical protein